MLAAVKWYLLVTLIGWVGWPLAFRHLRALPDRGYLSSRALGLLLTGYVFWITASLGLVANTPGAMLFAVLIVAGVGVWQYQTRPNQDESLRGWLRDNRTLVVLAEALFLLAFATWVVVRAHDPALNSTEKPMELTFLSGIRLSATFPPRDPWLAGYAISYYYFGYVIVAMLADLTGIASPVAFNLAIAMLFALTALGAYAVVYNLITLHRQQDSSEPTANRSPSDSAFSALLGPLLVAIMGNLAGALELLRALRFPRADAFWAWVDVQDLNTLLQPDVLWPPEKWRFWWWWRASRVIHDRDLTGTSIGLQPIDEFPMFSFLLGDMHPHVLALPFVLLVIGFALNLAAREPNGKRPVDPPGFVLYALVAGSLAFTNISGMPIYFFVMAGATILYLVRGQRRVTLDALGRALIFALGLLIAAIALYLPFYVGFRSQLSGILPNVIFPTRLPNFFVMFGPLLFIVLWYAVKEAAPWQPKRAEWLIGIPLAAGILVALVAVMTFGSTRALSEPAAQDFLLSSSGFDPAAYPLDSGPTWRSSDASSSLQSRCCSPF
jgi:YYY domain-containing protein